MIHRRKFEHLAAEKFQVKIRIALETMKETLEIDGSS